MSPHESSLQAKILRSNAAIRRWSEGLRDRGRRARAASRRQRMSAEPTRREPPIAPAPPRVVESSADASSAILPVLRQLPTRELVGVLVEDHGYAAEDAMRAVVVGMQASGYPADCDGIAAPDAFDVMERALGAW